MPKRRAGLSPDRPGKGNEARGKGFGRPQSDRPRGRTAFPAPLPLPSCPLPPMTTVGVTGGIGSGKSAFVARLAERDGVRVVLADDLAKRLMVEDDGVRADLEARFGPETFRPDGALSRSYLASRVFGDPRELAARQRHRPPGRAPSPRPRGRPRPRGTASRSWSTRRPCCSRPAASRSSIWSSWSTRPSPRAWRGAAARDGVLEADVRARMRHQIDPRPKPASGRTSSSTTRATSTRCGRRPTRSPTRSAWGSLSGTGLRGQV